MRKRRQERSVWTFVLIVGLSTLSLLSFAAIVGVMTSLSQAVLVTVLLLASCSAGASAAATLWVMRQSCPRASCRSTRPEESTLACACKTLKRLHQLPICRWVSALGCVVVRGERWIILGLFLGSVAVLFAATVIPGPASGEPSWKDFVAPIAGSLFGIAIARPLDLPAFRREDIRWFLILGIVMCVAGVGAWFGWPLTPPKRLGVFLISIGIILFSASVLKLLRPPVHT